MHIARNADSRVALTLGSTTTRLSATGLLVIKFVTRTVMTKAVARAESTKLTRMGRVHARSLIHHMIHASLEGQVAM
jgi:hypothetical protein